MERLRAHSSSNASNRINTILRDDLQPQLKNGLFINSISKAYNNKIVVNQKKNGDKYSKETLLNVRFVPLLEGKINKWML